MLLVTPIGNLVPWFRIASSDLNYWQDNNAKQAHGSFLLRGKERHERLALGDFEGSREGGVHLSQASRPVSCPNDPQLARRRAPCTKNNIHCMIPIVTELTAATLTKSNDSILYLETRLFLRCNDSGSFCNHKFLEPVDMVQPDCNLRCLERICTWLSQQAIP